MSLLRRLFGGSGTPTREKTNQRVRASWNGQVVAVSNDTVVVEGNHYFPLESVRGEYLRDSATVSLCFWKGKANYYDLDVDGSVNRDAAWYYANPSAMAAKIRGRVAFWNGVRVEVVD